MSAFDVAVIGAGIHGSAAAYHLASRGLRTVVLERGTPAGGPTGRSSAICRAYYTNRFLARCARDSIEMMKRFVELTGVDAEFRRTGLLFLHPPEDAPQVRENAAALNDLGIVTEVLDPDEIAARWPAFSLEGVGVGAWEANAGYADPAGTTVGLFRRAVDLGAEARLGAAVERIEPRDGGWEVVAADGSRARAARVLIAAGPWTRRLALQVGADLPLTVERHIVATFGWGEAEPVPAHADLVSGGYYFRPEGETQFLAGPVHAAAEADPDDYSERIGEQEAAAMAEAIVGRVPPLERSEPRGGWASLYDVSPDWQPVIGEVAPGVFVDAGTSGHGFKIAPALGAHVAALVAGEEVDPALEDFHPRRFEAGRRLAAGYREARILG